MQKLNVLKSKDEAQAPVDTPVDTPVITRSKVSISPNLTRNSIMVDIDGNEIDPRTRQIIKKAGY
jgi:hypothetical protein